MTSDPIADVRARIRSYHAATGEPPSVVWVTRRTNDELVRACGGAFTAKGQRYAPTFDERANEYRDPTTGAPVITKFEGVRIRIVEVLDPPPGQRPRKEQNA